MRGGSGAARLPPAVGRRRPVRRRCGSPPPCAGGRRVRQGRGQLQLQLQRRPGAAAPPRRALPGCCGPSSGAAPPGSRASPRRRGERGAQRRRRRAEPAGSGGRQRWVAGLGGRPLRRGGRREGGEQRSQALGWARPAGRWSRWRQRVPPAWASRRGWRGCGRLPRSLAFWSDSERRGWGGSCRGVRALCSGLEGKGDSDAFPVYLQREVPSAGQQRGGVGLGSLLRPSCGSLASPAPLGVLLPLLRRRGYFASLWLATADANCCINTTASLILSLRWNNENGNRPEGFRGIAERGWQ